MKNSMKNRNNLKSQEIKNTLGSKKSFFSLLEGFEDFLQIVLTVAVSFVGTYLFLPWHGIVSALPIVVVCSVICTFFTINPIIKTAIFFVSSFSISLLLGENVFDSIIRGVFCGIFYMLSNISVSLFKQGKISNRIVASLLIVASLGLHWFSNSTPWDAQKSNKEIMNYVKDSYSGEPLYATDVKFNSFDRTYSLMLVPHHDMGEALNVVLKDGEIITDEYVEYSEKYNMLVGAGQITYVIRKMFPELKFLVESNRIQGYPFSTSASILPKFDYSKYMDFSVYFTSYNGATEFSQLAEKCYRALLTSGFHCRTITFFGGIGTRYVAKISVPFDSFTGNLEKYVEPCDKNIFLYTSLK